VMLMLGGALYAAAPPVRDISHKRHPNLASAQRLARHAWEKILAAQKANEWDMEGHAQKAKELLDQVNNELKIAAGEANEHPGPH
jgi:F0F1-type ATP synthase membrane subunit b/b'